ncbi:unnamed protein product [Agarophyton chilense]|eukprot:gb/GEZJ01003215.1/.p1 GENE.gb/GEZJ01003215.1/~~gb/GEZJ01003215.1/.p1  ORF type:complete len:254 (-),score=22.06 gb/GEZJ01003215.1/:372-1133(-)
MTLRDDALDIPLDRSLQLQVLLPITVVTILMNLLRINLSKLILREPPISLAKTRDSSCLHRAQNVRLNSRTITRVQYEARRFYLLKEDGPLHKPPVNVATMSPLMNPESLANQVLSIIINVVPQMVLGAWARYSFAGIAVCRLPFTLTPRFRPMLQSGLDLSAQYLDVSYVSALSWYVLNLFGNAGLLSLFTSGSTGDDLLIPSALNQISMNVAQDKVFSQEREAVRKSSHNFGLNAFEEQLLQMPVKDFGTY